MKLSLGLALVVVGVGSASAQPPDPLRCWWHTSAGAVATGEQFEASLTCALREQAATRTVPDESRLSAATIQLAPFEVLGGSRPGDLRSPTHRFAQYHYTLRIIDRDAIGRDVRFPDIQIPYRVHTQTGGDWVEGRDRTYVVPGYAMRVLSLVPADAADIRDSGGGSFARATTLRLRSRMFDLLALTLALLGVAVAVPTVAAWLRSRRATTHEAPHELSKRAVMGAANRQLESIAAEGRGGWSPDLAARGLAALRLLVGAALGDRVAQRPAIATDATRAIVVDTGLLRRRHVEVSSRTTAADCGRKLALLGDDASATKRHQLEEMRGGLETFTRAVYGASFDREAASLDAALTSARNAARDFARGSR